MPTASDAATCPVASARPRGSARRTTRQVAVGRARGRRTTRNGASSTVRRVDRPRRSARASSSYDRPSRHDVRARQRPRLPGVEDLDELLLGVARAGDSSRRRSRRRPRRLARAFERVVADVTRVSDRSSEATTRSRRSSDATADDEHRGDRRSERAARARDDAPGSSTAVLREPVARAAHRLDRRAPERAVDLVPQVPDVDLDDVRIARRTRSPTRGRGSSIFDTTSPLRRRRNSSTASSRAVRSIGVPSRDARRDAGSKRRSPASSTAGRSPAPRRISARSRATRTTRRTAS